MSFLSKNKKETLKEFVKFAKEELQIKKVPKVLILNGRGEIKTTASYDYTKKEKVVKINGKNRALVDIMRSIGHELTHHKQYEQGRLKVKPPDIGGEIEDEANAKAGQLIKLFAKKQPKIYDLDEQEEPSSEYTNTTSTVGTENKGYPEVTKWSDIVGSKLSRGAANQIDQKSKWSDVVGSKLSRGAANQIDQKSKWSDIVGSKLTRGSDNQLK